MTPEQELQHTLAEVRAKLTAMMEAIVDLQSEVIALREAQEDLLEVEEVYEAGASDADIVEAFLHSLTRCPRCGRAPQ